MLATQDAPRMARKPIAKKTTGRPAKAASVPASKPQAADGEPELVTALRDAIKASGMTNRALAEAAGVPSSNIDRFLRGTGISLLTAGRIAAVLGFSLTKDSARK